MNTYGGIQVDKSGLKSKKNIFNKFDTAKSNKTISEKNYLTRGYSAYKYKKWNIFLNFV